MISHVEYLQYRHVNVIIMVVIQWTQSDMHVYMIAAEDSKYLLMEMESQLILCTRELKQLYTITHLKLAFKGAMVWHSK